MNGYDDWFLPSKDELGLMYTNLHAQSVGDFSSVNWYYSSSEYNDNSYYSPASHVWIRLFKTGGNSEEAFNSKEYSLYVRAARAF